MKAVLWIAGYGPGRSHDTLYSETFEREKDAQAFVAGQQYWRISRMEYTQPHSPGERTDEIGGVDVDKAIENIRQRLMMQSGCRVSTEQALVAWRREGMSQWLQREGRKNPMKRKYSPKPVGYSWIVLNDRVRKEFVLDEASFYDDWQSSGLSMQKFLRKYRDHIDTYIIDRQLHNWDRPAGYGQYPRSY